MTFPVRAPDFFSHFVTAARPLLYVGAQFYKSLRNDRNFPFPIRTSFLRAFYDRASIKEANGSTFTSAS